MAISVVQQSTLQVGSNVSSDSVNTGTNFSAGNDVFLFIDYYNAAAHTIAVTIAGVAATLIENTGALNNTEGQLWHLPGASNPGGSDAASWTRTGSGGSYARWSVMEVSGLESASALDKNPAINATTDPTPAVSNATGTLSQADEIAFSIVSNRETNGSSNWGAPTGWTMTNMNVQDWNNTSSGAVAYIIVSSTSSLTAQWIGSDSWGRCGIATFRMATTDVSLNAGSVTRQTRQFSATVSPQTATSLPAGAVTREQRGFSASVSPQTAVELSAGAVTKQVRQTSSSLALGSPVEVSVGSVSRVAREFSATVAPQSATAIAVGSVTRTGRQFSATVDVDSGGVALSVGAVTRTMRVFSATVTPQSAIALSAGGVTRVFRTALSATVETQSATELATGAISRAFRQFSATVANETTDVELSAGAVTRPSRGFSASVSLGAPIEISAGAVTRIPGSPFTVTLSLGVAVELVAGQVTRVTRQFTATVGGAVATYPDPPNTATIGLLPVRQDALTMAPERQDSLTLGPVRRDSLS